MESASADKGKGQRQWRQGQDVHTPCLATSGSYPVGRHGLFPYRAYLARCLVLFIRGSETSGYIRVIGEHAKCTDAHLHFSWQPFKWSRSDPWNSLEQDCIPLKVGEGYQGGLRSQRNRQVGNGEWKTKYKQHSRPVGPHREDTPKGESRALSWKPHVL